MPKYDLYVEYLGNLYLEELRMMAAQQNIPRSAKLTKPRLIVLLLDKKIEQAERHVITQARLWRLGKLGDQALATSIEELESLCESRDAYHNE